MSNLNKVLLIGRLGADPDTGTLASGKRFANLRLATSEKWKKDGETQERTEWHSIVAYDRLAEIMEEYLRKGSLVYIEGKLNTRKWTDKEGKDRYSTEIVARDMQMLGGKSAPQEQAKGGFDWKGAEAKAREGTIEGNLAKAAATGDFDDDIPF